MEIWPAIDLRGGKCVRLMQGDYQRETVFGDDPAAMAKRWIDDGARFLHLVDLDGARDGARINQQAIAAIVAAIAQYSPGLPVELGGGVRTSQDIQELLDLGLTRLVVGTSAIKKPDWFRQACEQFPGKLVLGVDARDGAATTDGWLETSDQPATSVAAAFDSLPMAAIVYTDIARDGMMAGVNLPAMSEMKAAVNTPVIASGGVTTLSDVEQLAAAGMDGCIIGRALYEGQITLAQAHAAAAA